MAYDVYDLFASPSEGGTLLSMSDIALMFGDVLFLKHLVTKWLSLRTKDLNVSLFMEGHVELFDEELIEDHLKGLLGVH